MLETLQKELNMQILPERFGELYTSMRDSWQTRAQQILSDDYIAQTLTENGVLTDWLPLILQAAGQLRKHNAMCLLVCLLERWIQEESICAEQYQPPVGTGLAYDFLHLFPAIPTIGQSTANLRSRGLPADVIADTLAEYDYCVKLCVDMLGRPAFDFGRLHWIRRVIANSLIHIGRFKYDLPGKFMKGFRVYRNEKSDLTVLADGIIVHRSGGILGSAGMEDADGSFTACLLETETAIQGHPVVNGLVQRETVRLAKTEWQLCLSAEDGVLGIHIPPGGGFDQKTMDEAFARAKDVFHKHYPDYPFKAFFCSTWLLSPQLRPLLKPTSNILSFQNNFTRLPCYSDGKGCFSFLFGYLNDPPKDMAELPEETSLQRAVKQLYLSGGCLHEGEGFFF